MSDNDINRMREDSQWRGRVDQTLKDIRGDIRELKDTQTSGLNVFKEALGLVREHVDTKCETNNKEHKEIGLEIGAVRRKQAYILGVGTAAGAAIVTALRIFGGFGK